MIQSASMRNVFDDLLDGIGSLFALMGGILFLPLLLIGALILGLTWNSLPDWVVAVGGVGILVVFIVERWKKN